MELTCTEETPTLDAKPPPRHPKSRLEDGEPLLGQIFETREQFPKKGLVFHSYKAAFLMSRFGLS